MVALSYPVISASGDRTFRARQVFVMLCLSLAAMAALSLGTGASGISVVDLAANWLRGEPIAQRDQVVLFDIRLPRLVMGVLVGAALAVSGALMQGLFRNPLADPGLVGVGAGAGLGAVLAIVLGGMLPFALAATIGQYLVPLAAFLGGWGATLLLYAVSSRQGRTSVATMLLAGIALGALAGAATGILIYLADDRQLRDLTFWGMGSLGGASWQKIAMAAPLILPVLLLSPLLARGLNGLALGEAAALHTGIEVERIKSLTILSVAAATGAAVAVAGGIGFIGIVVPHLLRLAIGPDHRFLLPNAALLGATLLLGADIIARLVVAPAELPIGIVTAVLGAPVFLFILLRSRGLPDL
jgi:iron complex transport system permease protein